MDSIAKVWNLFDLSDDYSLLSDVPDAVRLDSDSQEYNEVAAEFFSSLSDQNRVQIVKVSPRRRYYSNGTASEPALWSKPAVVGDYSNCHLLANRSAELGSAVVLVKVTGVEPVCRWRS